LSIYAPKRVDLGTFGRQRASQVTVLLSLVMQALVVGCSVITFVIAGAIGKPWLAFLVFLMLAAFALLFYRWTLVKAESLGLERRELLTAELCRVQ